MVGTRIDGADDFRNAMAVPSDGVKGGDRGRLNNVGDARLGMYELSHVRDKIRLVKEEVRRRDVLRSEMSYEVKNVARPKEDRSIGWTLLLVACPLLSRVPTTLYDA